MLEVVRTCQIILPNGGLMEIYHGRKLNLKTFNKHKDLDGFNRILISPKKINVSINEQVVR